MRRLWLVTVVVFGGACGHPAGAIDAHLTGDTKAFDDAPESGWTTLISRSWTVPAGTETYKCTRILVQTDQWITGFRAIAPLGTHHSILTISTTPTPLGDYDCSPNNLDQELMYAWGIGTDDVSLPVGVAIHLEAGMYLNLNLHLQNATDSSMTQTSGVAIQTIDAAQVVNEADMTFAGTFNISIPNDGAPHDAVGGCAIPNDWHVFTMWPHMHAAGVHQKLVTTHAMVQTTLLDSDYAFDDQHNYPIADTLIHAGDQLEVTCTYVNSTAVNPLIYGDSANAEMCFTGLYKYPADPAGTSIYTCVSS